MDGDENPRACGLVVTDMTSSRPAFDKRVHEIPLVKVCFEIILQRKRLFCYKSFMRTQVKESYESGLFTKRLVNL